MRPEFVAPEVMRETFTEAEAAANAIQNELNAGGYGRAGALQMIAERALTADSCHGSGDRFVCRRGDDLRSQRRF